MYEDARRCVASFLSKEGPLLGTFGPGLPFRRWDVFQSAGSGTGWVGDVSPTVCDPTDPKEPYQPRTGPRPPPFLLQRGGRVGSTVSTLSNRSCLLSPSTETNDPNLEPGSKEQKKVGRSHKSRDPTDRRRSEREPSKEDARRHRQAGARGGRGGRCREQGEPHTGAVHPDGGSPR
eukprot:scaffold2741_cov424-Pavlova_lutheri.AAC.2